MTRLSGRGPDSSVKRFCISFRGGCSFMDSHSYSTRGQARRPLGWESNSIIGRLDTQAVTFTERVLAPVHEESTSSSSLARDYTRALG
ncbi:hypothetical protein BDM02DRAFT_3106366 [Thelephora ganbajun]|uniref:Uncharacterized protein n=1 Tax=Thelephora ganbajun TaxID=370292 RepID=A0ACB6ZYC3_THEGA|nr:hypothetical protein BDM02DRAFT_3106366 [Thelephora ganbajun]